MTGGTSTLTPQDGPVVETAQRRTLMPLIQRYLRERQARGQYNAKSVSAVGPRLRTLADSFGARPIEKLSQRAIERWLESQAHLSPNSRSSYFASVRTFTRWLKANGIVATDPSVGVDKVRRTRAVPRAQSPAGVRSILDACSDERDRAIVWLMVGLGLRSIEVSRLRWEHYDTHHRTILVTGKGGHERWLPVTAEVRQALDAVRGRGWTGPIICSKLHPNEPVGTATIIKRVGQLMQDAGVKHAPYDGVSGHALRHTAASDVLDQCGDLRVVQEMLGHQHLTSTAIYLRRARIGEMREAMEGRAYTATEDPGEPPSAS